MLKPIKVTLSHNLNLLLSIFPVFCNCINNKCINYNGWGAKSSEPNPVPNYIPYHLIPLDRPIQSCYLRANANGGHDFLILP